MPVNQKNEPDGINQRIDLGTPIIEAAKKLGYKPMQNDALKITIDHEGKRFFNGMPDYEYLKIEALNKIIDLLTTKEHHASK